MFAELVSEWEPERDLMLKQTLVRCGVLGPQLCVMEVQPSKRGKVEGEFLRLNYR